MPGYTGYHINKKSGWNVTTIAAVVVAHLVFIAGLYRLSQTEYIQNLIKVSKLVTVQEPVKPPDPPPPQTKEPEQDKPPELPKDRPPVIKDLPPEPMPQAPVEDQPVSPPSVGEASEPRPGDNTSFAIGKGRSRFALYEDLLMGAIQAVYKQPPDLSDALEYAVLCQLVLDDEGYVLSYKLLNSSGSEVFDRSAQQALSRLRQVRPPPEGMSRTVVVKFFPP